MPLRPFINNEPNPLTEEHEVEVVSDIPDELQNVLADAGLAAKPSIDEGMAPIRKIFNKHGAGIDEIAKRVATVMNYGENDATRLKACQIAMQVQGLLADIDEKPQQGITINIIGNGNKTLVNLVCPDGR